MTLQFLEKKLLRISKTVTKRPRSMPAFVSLLNRAFKKHHMKFSYKHYPLGETTHDGLYQLTDKSSFQICGEYEPPICEGDPDIIVVVCDYTNSGPSYITYPYTLRLLLCTLFEVIGHEMIHRHQAKKCEKSPRPYKAESHDHAYLGSYSEIDAYGFSAAIQLLYENHESVLELYRKHFSSDDIRYKRFLKKRIFYIKKLAPTLLYLL